MQCDIIYVELYAQARYCTHHDCTYITQEGFRTAADNRSIAYLGVRDFYHFFIAGSVGRGTHFYYCYCVYYGNNNASTRVIIYSYIKFSASAIYDNSVRLAVIKGQFL